MGQTLSEPVTNKETAICQDDNYKVIILHDSFKLFLSGLQIALLRIITLQS